MSAPANKKSSSSSPELSNSIFPSCFDKNPEPIFLLDEQSKILYVNAAWEKLTGESGGDFLGERSRLFLVGPGNQKEILLSLLAPTREVLEGKMITVRRNSPRTPGDTWEISFFPLCDSESRPTLILGRVRLLPGPGKKKQVPLPQKLLALRDRLARWHSLDQLTSDHPDFQRIREQIRLACQSLEPLWIMGEPGSGKQRLARILHSESPTRLGPFVALDCRHVIPDLLKGLLFGDKGLPANLSTGTILFQEPQFLPKEFQQEIVDWLKHPNPKTFRLLSASSPAPQEMVTTGNLLSGFYLAFSVLTLSLPPLRERQGDFPILAEQIISRIASATGKPSKTISAEAIQFLQAGKWPGNVRELFATLRAAFEKCESNTIQVSDLPFYLTEPKKRPEENLSLNSRLEQLERRLIRQALKKAKNNKAKAAKLLDISRSRLLHRMKALGIESG